MPDDPSAAGPVALTAAFPPGRRHHTGRQVAWLRLVQMWVLALAVGSVYLGASFWMDGHPGQAPVFRYVDASAGMTVDEVHALGDAAFEEVPAMQSLGYSSAAYWFRLRRPPAAADQRQVVLVQPSYVDDVRFYLPDPHRPGRWTVQQQGDHHPFAQRPREELGFTADANVPVGQWMYVRVQASTAVSVHVRLLSEADVVDEDALTMLGVGVYAGGVLLLAIGSILSAVVARDRFWALNALFQLVTAVAVFMYFGLGNRFLWPQQPGWANAASNLWSTLHFLCGSVFFRIYVGQHKAPRWMLHLLELMVLLLLVQLAMVLAGRAQAGFVINGVLVPLAVVTAACLSFGVRARDGVEQFLLRFNMLGTLAYFVVFFLLHHGFIGATFMLLYPGLYLNALTAVVLHLMLLRRNTLLVQRRERAARALELTRQRVLSERREREEDGRFLSMLLHEVRSPLTVIAMALGALTRRLQALDDHDGPLRRDLQRIDDSINQMRGLFLEVESISEAGHRKRRAGADDDAAGGVQPWVDAQWLLDRLVAEYGQAGERVDLSGWTALRDAGVLRGARTNGGLPLVTLMIRNLVNNALAYSPAGSPVALQADVCPDAQAGTGQLCLSVVNRVGDAGFPDTERLFQKYYRAAGARGSVGTGLGLYWVRGMAHILGGDIRYAAEGQNIRFALVMPLHAPEEDGHAEKA